MTPLMIKKNKVQLPDGNSPAVIPNIKLNCFIHSLIHIHYPLVPAQGQGSGLNLIYSVTYVYRAPHFHCSLTHVLKPLIPSMTYCKIYRNHFLQVSDRSL